MAGYMGYRLSIRMDEETQRIVDLLAAKYGLSRSEAAARILTWGAKILEAKKLPK